MAKAAYWTVTDTEARKRGEQTGLDTLVVHAVNDARGTPRFPAPLHLSPFSPPDRDSRVYFPSCSFDLLGF